MMSEYAVLTTYWNIFNFIIFMGEENYVAALEMAETDGAFGYTQNVRISERILEHCNPCFPPYTS